MGHVVVVGAGPGGAGLALLLAQRGVEVTLLERQSDFAREFRGEVLMPGGVEALEQMGLGPALGELPTSRPDPIALYLNRARVLEAGLDPAFFEGRPPLTLSQPALLERMVEEAARHPCFRFVRGARVRDLLREGERVVGVQVLAGDASHEIRGDLVIGADGRASVVRRRAGFEARPRDVPMDVVWCKVPCPAGLHGARIYLGRGHLLLCYRSWDDALQVAWVILKGTYGELRRQGIERWVEDMAHHVSPDLAGHLRAHVDAVRHPFLLDVVSDAVEQWTKPGALLLGDAAHTMSPVGAQGLNVALRDAIVATNHLVPVLVRPDPEPAAVDAAARAVERERRPEIRTLQRLQALPPRVVLSRAFWAEPLRRLLVPALRQPAVQRLALARGRAFPFGVTEVALRV